MRFLVLAASAVFLTACETTELTKKECLGPDGVGADWGAIGFTDGLKGELENRFEEHVARCAEFGAVADKAAYTAGRTDGLENLCVEQNGFDFAYRGDVYRGVCSVDQEPDFLTGYVGGRRVFYVKKARDAAKSDYDSAVSSVNYHLNQIDRAKGTLAKTDATEKELKRARKNLKYSRDQLPYAEDRVDEKLYELGRADEALENALASVEDFKTSSIFPLLYNGLLEGHAFARAEPAIDHCYDEGEVMAVTCQVKPAAEIRGEQSICAVGPGDALNVGSRNEKGPDGDLAELRHRYDFYPLDVERNRRARRSTASFDVVFDATADPVAVNRIICAAPIEPLP